jgi:hypothetical protein
MTHALDIAIIPRKTDNPGCYYEPWKPNSSTPNELGQKKKKSYDFKIINLKNICIIKNTVR